MLLGTGVERERSKGAGSGRRAGDGGEEEEDLKHPLRAVLYTRVVTDYLLERYERGISGNYKRRPDRGIFGYSVVGGLQSRERTGEGVRALLRNITEILLFFTNPCIFSLQPRWRRRRSPSFAPSPRSRHSPSASPGDGGVVFLLLPIHFYAGTRLPRARNLFLSSCSHE